jgi:hypothetical protein
VPGAPGSVFYLGLGVLFSSNSALSASSVVNTLRSLPRHLRSSAAPLLPLRWAFLFVLGFSLCPLCSYLCDLCVTVPLRISLPRSSL